MKVSPYKVIFTKLCKLHLYVSPISNNYELFCRVARTIAPPCFLHGSALINMTLSSARQKFWGVLFIRADDTHANWNFRRVRRVIFVRAACDIWIHVFPGEKFSSRFRRFPPFAETLNKLSLSQLQLRLHPPLHSSSRRCDALKWKTERKGTLHLFANGR